MTQLLQHGRNLQREYSCLALKWCVLLVLSCDMFHLHFNYSAMTVPFTYFLPFCCCFLLFLYLLTDLPTLPSSSLLCPLFHTQHLAEVLEARIIDAQDATRDSLRICLSLLYVSIPIVLLVAATVIVAVRSIWQLLRSVILVKAHIYVS